MDYNFYKMKTNAQLDEMFRRVIADIPLSEKQEIVLVKKGEMITYESFCEILYRCVLEYIPDEKESSLVKAFRMLPKAKRNIQRIIDNRNIIKQQKTILDTYFSPSGELNIKAKTQELKNNIDGLLVEEKSYQYLESALKHFEDQVLNAFLKDMNELYFRLEKRDQRG